MLEATTRTVEGAHVEGVFLIKLKLEDSSEILFVTPELMGIRLK